MTDLGYRWDVVLNGRGYMLDRASQAHRHQSVPAIRQQADTGDRPGEQSLNPAGLWRRVQESWHHGAGQSWLDRDASDPYRFDASLGVDPWSKWGLSLLPDTNRRLNLGGGGGGGLTTLIVADSHMHVVDSQTWDWKSTANGTLWTDVLDFSTTPDTPSGHVATDGTNVYVATQNGIYRDGTGGVTKWLDCATTSMGPIGYCNGRLLAGFYDDGLTPANLYDLSTIPASGGTALPTALWAHPSAGWVWNAFCEGPNHIYAAGQAGDKSAIYRIAEKADGSGLDVPIRALQMPPGEVVRCMLGYLGNVIIGTDVGVRFAVPDGDGNLQVGELIPTDLPVLCLDGRDKYVWYGLSQYATGKTGLGRLDLSVFTSDLTPAYASDLMCNASGVDVTSTAYYLGRRYIAARHDGVYQELTTKVASGWLSTGRITYGLSDTKTALKASVLHDALPSGGSVQVDLAADGGTSSTVGTSDVDGATAYEVDIAPQVARSFEATVTLAGGAALHFIGLKVNPNPDRTDLLQVPLDLRDRHDDPYAVAERPIDVDDEWGVLYGLYLSREVVTFEQRGRTWQVVVDDYQWVPDEASGGPVGAQGTFVVTLKVVG